MHFTKKTILQKRKDFRDKLKSNKLLTFPEVIRKSSQTLEPQNISNYLAELASSFHSYYAKERVIDLENKILTEARIYLVNATRIVIRNGLKVLGVSAPEQM